MKNKKNAESLVGIIVAIFILSFTLLGIINILDYNEDINYDYTREINKYILNSNSSNILRKIDITNINNDEEFYLFKDEENKEYKILTGSLNENYKYVNYLGEKVDKDENLGKNYTRYFSKKQDILRHHLKPEEINDLVFHFDANNINGLNNSGINDGEIIQTWKDLSGNNFDAKQTSSSKRAKLTTNGINSKPIVEFDGIDDIFNIDSNIKINNDNVCSTELTFKEKSFAIVLKTGNDVTTQQVIYEQGGKATGYNFVVANGKIYAGIHNKATVPGFSCFTNTNQVRDDGHKFKSVELDEAIPNTVYYIMIVQDSTNKDSSGNFIDNQNKLQIYLNAKLVMETDHVDPQPEHHLVGLGGVNEWNVRPWSPYKTIESGDGEGGCDGECMNFKGGIGEFISWNHALTKDEVIGVQNYFVQKWLGGKENIHYNTIKSNIKEYNY